MNVTRDGSSRIEYIDAIIGATAYAGVLKINKILFRILIELVMMPIGRRIIYYQLFRNLFVSLEHIGCYHRFSFGPCDTNCLISLCGVVCFTKLIVTIDDHNCARTEEAIYFYCNLL